MKEPMFSVEIDPEGLRIVVTQPDGTRVTIRGGQSESPVLDHEARCPQFASFLEQSHPERAQLKATVTKRSGDMEHVRLEPVSTAVCVEEAERLRMEAQRLPPGAQQQELMRMARQTYTAAHLSEWLRDPLLRGPTLGI
jgi:hypothetical protein